MRFQFIHAADLHIDSPLASLGLKDPAVAARFARANRDAVEALVRETIESRAAFLIIAGDIFDGDWRDVSTGLFFTRALGDLHRAGIPTLIIKGNHDADSVIARSLTYPANAFTFASNKAETKTFDALRVALHGRSFGVRNPPGDFLGSYPARREGWLNIGLLHTGLDGTRAGHESYAPCTVEDLRRFGYDYWALGHIHAAEVVSRDPWIVYPGNLQGRSVRETGAKGAMRVTVDDGRIVEVEPLHFDGARWAHESLDVSGCLDEADVLPRVADALARLHAEAGDRPIAIRITLEGMTPAHSRLLVHRETIEAEARALGFQIAGDCWVERVRIATKPPPRRIAATNEPDALDIPGLLAAAAEDSEFAAAVVEIMGTVAEKLPRHLRDNIAAEDVRAVAERVALARDFLGADAAA
jgi:DNA repair exonuclease SbcCD nuclease subunit